MFIDRKNRFKKKTLTHWELKSLMIYFLLTGLWRKLNNYLGNPLNRISSDPLNMITAVFNFFKG